MNAPYNVNVYLNDCPGVPMSLSHPHFLYGDEKLIDAIGGIEPNETLHQNALDIEPVSEPLIEHQ